jgi:hypothetical protein
MGNRLKGESDFSINIDHPFLADTGDFQYSELVKSVDVKAETGDLDITIRYSGFQVKPGRPPVSRIPFEIHLEPYASLAAWHFQILSGGVPGANLSWDESRRFIEINPAHREDALPMDFELHYYIHNGAATTAWEAKEMYGAQTDREAYEETSLTPLCDTGTLRLEVTLPEGHSDPGFPGPGTRPCLAEVALNNKLSDVKASSQLISAIKWDQEARRLSTQTRFPRPNSKHTLFWHTREDVPLPRDFFREISQIWHWQRSLIEVPLTGTRPLDNECPAIAEIISDESRFGNVGRVDIGLFVSDTNDNKHEPGQPYQPVPGSLRLVGSTFPLPDSSSWSFPFGAGVAGRAFRIGRAILHDVFTGVQTNEAYMTAAQGQPLNFYRGFEKEVGLPSYAALLAVPVFPVEMRKQWGTEVRSARFMLLMLCVGTTYSNSALLRWTASQVDEFSETAGRKLEARVYTLANPA